MTPNSKYNDILNQYNTNLVDADTTKKVQEIISAKFAENNTVDVYKNSIRVST